MVEDKNSDRVKWRFKQCFGEQRSLDTIQEGDMLTGTVNTLMKIFTVILVNWPVLLMCGCLSLAVEFSENGEFIATGDRVCG